MIWLFVIGMTALGMAGAQHPGPIVSTLSGDVQGSVMYDSQGNSYIY